MSNTSITCPNCGGSGYDDAFSSACDCASWISKIGSTNLARRFAGEVPMPAPLPSGNGTGSSSGAGSIPMATEKQINFLSKLVEERSVPGLSAEDLEIVKRANHALQSGQISKRGASEFIDAMMAIKRPVAPVAKPVERSTSGLDLSSIPSGLYAVPGGDTRLKIKIDNVEKGKWAGWIFVKDGAVYGEGTRYGSQRPGETYRGKIEDALRVIAADPIEAMKAYGRLTETCGLCSRHLEDETSVEIGIGPICRKKLGI